MTVVTRALQVAGRKGRRCLPGFPWAQQAILAQFPHLEIRDPTTCPLGCGEVERRTDTAGVPAVLSGFEFSPLRAISDHSGR